MKKRNCVLALLLAATMAFSINAFAEDAVELDDGITIEETVAVEASHTEGGTPMVEPSIQHDESDCMTGDPVQQIPPTCTDYGINRYECKIDAGFFHEQIIEPLGHLFTIVKVDTEETCKTKGSYHLVCERCGAEESVSYEIPVNPEKHVFDGWVVEKKATCAEPGLRVRWCKLCGKKQQEEIPVLEPDFEIRRTRQDCFTVKVEQVCKNCNGEVDGHRVALPDEKSELHAHVLEAKYIIAQVDPTCTTKGYIDYVCSKEEESADHDRAEYSTSINKKTVYRIETPKLGHDWSDWILRHDVGDGDNEFAYYVRTCKRCGKMQENVTPEEPKSGEVSEKKNGLCQEDNGDWYLYEDGEVDSEFTGIATKDGAEFFVANGRMCSEANGLALYDGTWYFLAAGKIARGYDGFAEYNGEWFMIKNGELDVNASGLYPYNGGTFAFGAGRLLTGINGLWMNVDNEWYCLAHGKVIAYTGEVEYGGAKFNVVNGKLA